VASAEGDDGTPIVAGGSEEVVGSGEGFGSPAALLAPQGNLPQFLPMGITVVLDILKGERGNGLLEFMSNVLWHHGEDKRHWIIR